MKYFKVTQDSECFAISLVEDPAIESDFIALSKEKILLQTDEKRMVTGAVLIPDKPIYRIRDGREYYIVFDAQTIQKLAEGFLYNNYQHNISVAHSEGADDVFVVESWIKTSEQDKSVSLGIDAPIGTWFVSMKVNNDEIWQKVKDGEYKGFSIEAIVGLDEIINTQLSKMDKEFLSEIKGVFEEALGKVVVKQEAETPNEEVEGLKAKITEVEGERDALRQELDAVKADNENLKAKIAELEAALNEANGAKDAVIEEMNKVKEEMAAVKEENVKLSAQPSAKPVGSEGAVVGKNYSAAVKLQLQ